MDISVRRLCDVAIKYPYYLLQPSETATMRELVNDLRYWPAVSLHFDIARLFEDHPVDLGDNGTRARWRGTEKH